MKTVNESVMTDRNLKQLQFESAAWTRELSFMKEENVHLKNRLSEVLKDPIETTLLKEAEQFQNSFISQDDVINFLRNDLLEFEKLLLHHSSEKEFLFKSIQEKYETISNHLRTAKSQFANLKIEFNRYLSANF